ncbi:Hsp20/alpha crystallin family protein [Aphanothece microscopica]
MLSLRTSSPFELFDRLEQQLTQQLQGAERVPAAEVHETPEGYAITLELPGVDRDAIDVKATDRTLVISAERRSQRSAPAAERQAEAGSAQTSKQQPSAGAGPLLSEFRYGTWSRSFRFPMPIEAQQLNAVYRDGLLTITAPKAHKVTSVAVKVEG